MKKIFKNYNYLSVIAGTLVTLIFMITYFFIKNRVYFSISFALNIVMNFVVMGYLLLSKQKIAISQRFKGIALYLLITLFILCIDIIIITNLWDMNIYNNLMYATNIKLYLGIYALFVVFISLFSIYIIIKEDFVKAKK